MNNFPVSLRIPTTCNFCLFTVFVTIFTLENLITSKRNLGPHTCNHCVIWLNVLCRLDLWDWTENSNNLLIIVTLRIKCWRSAVRGGMTHIMCYQKEIMLIAYFDFKNLWLWTHTLQLAMFYSIRRNFALHFVRLALHHLMTTPVNAKPMGTTE